MTGRKICDIIGPKTLEKNVSTKIVSQGTDYKSIYSYFSWDFGPMMLQIFWRLPKYYPYRPVILDFKLLF